MSERFWAVVPAAGAGRRMASAIPKQYLPLLGRSVIEHTLERLLSHARIEAVFVALSPGDPWWPTTAQAQHPRVVRVDGGAERCHSVRNALESLRTVAQASDWVLVHDAARPCIHRSDLDLLFRAWGIEMDLGKAVTDFDFATRLRGQDNQVENNPFWLSIPSEALNRDNIIKNSAYYPIIIESKI